MKFRTRLLGTALATLAVGLGALIIIGNVLLGHRIDQEATNLLEARVQAEVAALTITPAHVVVRETVNDVELDRASWVFDHGRVVEHPPGAPAMLDARAVALGEAATTREVDGPGDIRLRSEPLSAPGAATPSGAVVVSLSVAPLERVEQEVLIGSLVIGVLIFLAGAIAISSALSGALRPVAEMTASAGDWGAHDLDRRFALGPPRDELTALAATLDGLLSRIAASRRHEQRFASEVAHELRTPLAGIIGRAELGLAAGGDAEALQSILAQANRLGAAIDTLLAVARQEIDGPAGEVDPVVIAREFEGVDVHVSGHIPNVEGDAELLRRALAPLVENARRFAVSRVSINVVAAGPHVRIEVRDDGPGIARDIAERVFAPGFQGAPGAGAGLGMPLARRLARLCGGDVELGEGPGGCVVVMLPAVGT